MSAALTAEEQAEYTKIIDNILTKADLQTVTRKLIRQGLQDAVQKDLSAHKDAIKSLIEQRFDAISTETQMPTPPEPRPASPRAQKVNGHPPRSPFHADAAPVLDEDEEADGQINVALPPAKKQKREKSLSAEEDADARLAAELQAQENRLAKGRTTRGGTGGRQAKVKAEGGGNKRKSKSKSEKKVRDSEDSDVEGGGGGAKEKRKAGGGFAKPFALSPALQGLVGDAQVVKKIWEYIKLNDLQDPNDKREIICDDKMQAVFKTAKVNMFKMNKHLGNHLHEPEENEQVV